MKRHCVSSLLLLALMGFGSAGLAQEKGSWLASSNTATSITGEVAFSETRMAINYATFPIVKVRDLAAGEVSAVFDADSNAEIHGHLYRLTIPASKTFLHKNTLCGSADTRWMATYVAGNTLHLAFFSSQNPPVFTPEAISNSTDMCGTFGYSR